MKKLFFMCVKKEPEELNVRDLFNDITDPSSKGSTVNIINSAYPKLINIIDKFDYSDSLNLDYHLCLCLWSTISLLALAEEESKHYKYDYIEFEILKRKVEREHERILRSIIIHYKQNDLFLQDYFSFITMAQIWSKEPLAEYLISFIPTNIIFVDEFVLNLSELLVDEYLKKNDLAVDNICTIISLMILNKIWTSASYGSLLCIEFFLKVFESIYDFDKTDNFKTIEHILKWMRYFVERMNQSDHICSAIDLLSTWLYFHSKNVHQVLNFSSLIYFCCHLYQPIAGQITPNHIFQTVILSMINSNDFRTVAIGYDILISLTDRLGNKRLLNNPKLYSYGDISHLKKPTRRSVDDSYFAHANFVYLTDSIHKVVQNSIARFISSQTLARKVNTLVSILAIEACDSAQGLTSIISFALSIQQTMIEIRGSSYKPKSSISQDFTPDPFTSYYHGSVASWFSLVCYVNAGDLDLFRNYVFSVIDLRADCAPYLLPSIERVVMLPQYIYDLDKSLYFDIDKIQGAIENSWVALTNNKDLLNSIKIPRSNFLVEKYVDIQFMNSFGIQRLEEQVCQDDMEIISEHQVSSSEFLKDEKSMFMDVENRYSEAFKEPYDRFIFDNIEDNTD